MAFVPAADTYQVHQRATLHDQEIENVHYFRVAGGTDPAILAQTCHDAWVADFMPLLSRDYELRETYVVDLSSETAPTGQAVTVPFPIGGVTQNAAPGSVSLCISLRTAGRGRSARGRQYISGLSEATIEGNAWSSTSVGVIIGGFATYRASVEAAAAAEMVVVSRVENGVQRDQALVQPVTALIVVDNFIDSQRRRLSGRGN